MVVELYDEEDFIDEDFGFYEPDDNLQNHSNCCGIFILYLDGWTAEAARINRLTQEVDIMQNGISIELVLTDAQIVPGAEWDDSITKEKKRAAIRMLKRWNYKLRSSFVNPNSGNKCYVFFRNAGEKRNLSHSWFNNSK